MPLRVTMLIFALLATHARSNADALRYRLRVGDQLEYAATTSTLDATNAPIGPARAERIDLWVIASEDSGLLVLATLRGESEPEGQSSGGAIFRINDRGERTQSTEVLARFESYEAALAVLPGLDPAVGAPDGWSGSIDAFGRFWRQRRVSGTGARQSVSYELIDPTGVSEACGLAESGTYQFDADGGIVTRVEMTRRDARRRQIVERQIVFRRRATVPAEWCAKRAAECARYERALRFEDALIDEIENRPDRSASAVQRLAGIWDEFLAQPPRDSDSPLRHLAQARRARAESVASGLLERARLSARWINTTAAHWSLQDASGMTITSESARSGVTVECFWSSDSIASQRVFESLRRLAREFPKNPISIICLNLDSDPNPAKRAAQLAGAGMLHVFSGPPIGGDVPTELPVVRILDAKSRVLRVHFGWRPSYAESIRAATGWR